MKILLIIISLFVCLIFSSFAANCGGEVKCSCGDNVVDYYNLQEDLVCEDDALIVSTNELDCNGYSIIGNNTGSGLLIKGKNYVEIKNCNIENFNIGLEITQSKELDGNGWGSFWYVYHESRFTKVNNNTFKNNRIGIYSKESLADLFFGNKFISNKDHGVYLDSKSSTIWNNSFYNTSVYYKNTKNKIFCDNGVGNLYYNTKGPLCNCIVPIDNLNINSNVEFCSGRYNVSNINLGSNSQVYCNGTIFNGNETNMNDIGFLINGRTNTKIDSCSFTNYNKGIEVKSRQDLQYNSYVYFTSQNNKIYNSSFYNLSVGIDFNNNEDGVVFNSTFKDIVNNSITLNSKSSKFYGNDFYEKSPYFTSTSNNTFCYNNITNNFYNGAKKLGCGCFYPFEGLNINSDVNLCHGNYKLENGLDVTGSNLNIICDNTNIIGSGNNSGLSILGRQNNNISGCSISNYTNGILLNYEMRRGDNTYDKISFPSRDNQIDNFKIFNVSNGVEMRYVNSNSYGVLNHINDSLISADNLILNNKVPNNILINNSYFGINNITKLENKFYDFKKINLINYNVDNFYQYLELELNQDGTLIIGKKNSKFFKNDFELMIYFQINNSIYSKELFVIQDDFNKYKKLNLENFTFDKLYVEIDPKNKLDKNILFDKRQEFIFLDNSLSNNKYTVNFNFYENKNIFQDYLQENFNVVNDSNFDIKINFNIINSSESLLKNPYEAEVFSYKKNHIRIIDISSNTIYGLINGFIYYKNNKIFFELNSIKKRYLSDDIQGIKIYDYLIQDTKNLYNNTKKIFSGNIFDKKELYLPIKNEKNDSINYRIWKLETNYSYNLKSYLDKEKLPIVMGGGLFSDISTWNDLGEELSNDGYLVYLIEITGGEGSECFNCYNYNYSFLVNNVFENYLNFIVNDSNRSSIKYVGHSNGARVALDYLEFNKNLDIIDTFVAVGMPGAFEDSSFLYDSIKNIRPILNETLKDKKHISIYDLVTLGFNPLKFSGSKISYNLWEKYEDWMFGESIKQPGSNVEINNFKMVSGNFLFSGNDGIVTMKDQYMMYDNVNPGVTNKSEHIVTRYPHLMMSSFSKIKREVKEFVENE